MQTSDYLNLTPAQAAELSGAQRSYLYNLISAGVLETRLVAGRRFILRSSFEKWNKAYQVRRHIKRSAVASVATAQPLSA